MAEVHGWLIFFAIDGFFDACDDILLTIGVFQFLLIVILMKYFADIFFYVFDLMGEMLDSGQ